MTKAQRLGFARVEDRVPAIPAGGWHRISAGDGAMIGNADHPSSPRRGRERPRGGPRLYNWAYLPYGSDAAPGWEKGLLIRRSIAQPDELAFFLTHAADGTALADLVQVAGTRWAIEACFPPRTGLRPTVDPGFEAAKGEVGLDQYEVRSWTGWHRHVTLAMLAHAYLATLCKVVVGGKNRPSTWQPICSRSPSRNCAACSGASSGPTYPTSTPCSPGHAGDGDTSNAPDDVTGSAELPLKHGCSTSPRHRSRSSASPEKSH